MQKVMTSQRPIAAGQHSDLKMVEMLTSRNANSSAINPDISNTKVDIRQDPNKIIKTLGHCETNVGEFHFFSMSVYNSSHSVRSRVTQNGKWKQSGPKIPVWDFQGSQGQVVGYKKTFYYFSKGSQFSRHVLIGNRAFTYQLDEFTTTHDATREEKLKKARKAQIPFLCTYTLLSRIGSVDSATLPATTAPPPSTGGLKLSLSEAGGTSSHDYSLDSLQNLLNGPEFSEILDGLNCDKLFAENADYDGIDPLM